MMPFGKYRQHALEGRAAWRDEARIRSGRWRRAVVRPQKDTLLTGIYGKLPSHGDFVRRELPQSFVQPWDAWLQGCLGAAHEALGGDFAAVWEAAPPWRFRLPAGACGDTAVAGVLLTSQDAVGRRFPLTLAALLPAGAHPPGEPWYAALAQAGIAGRDRGDGADALLARLPAEASGSPSGDEGPAVGWWTGDGRSLGLAFLPDAVQFLSLLQSTGAGAAPRFVTRAVSHEGMVRTVNEDAFIDRSDIGLWAVADGAGGHGAGDIASAAATAALADVPTGLTAAEVLAQVRLRLGAVHGNLQRRVADSATGATPATTIVVLIARGGHFACLWAGDSRAYLLREGTLSQVTHDHSLVQELVDSGAMAPEKAEGHRHANIITRAVGCDGALDLDKVSGQTLPGDLLLLCTDGLFKALPEAEITRLLVAGGGADKLLEDALRAGARDNVTAMTVKILR